MRKLILLLSLVPSIAFAQSLNPSSWLPETSLSAAQNRSALEASVMGVSDGSLWWGIVQFPCIAGPTVFIQIEATPRSVVGYDFTANPVGSSGSTGLSTLELSTLMTSAQLVANGCF